MSYANKFHRHLKKAFMESRDMNDGVYQSGTHGFRAEPFFEDLLEECEQSQQADVSGSYLILSGEGNIYTEHQFCMDCKTLKEANRYFDNFKLGEFAETYLYIYEAVKVREA